MVSTNLIEQSETKLWFINREKGLTLLSLPLPPPKPSQTSYRPLKVFIYLGSKYSKLNRTY